MKSRIKLEFDELLGDDLEALVIETKSNSVAQAVKRSISLWKIVMSRNRLSWIRPGARHPAYQAWCQARLRCYNKDHPSYPAWGGRGIKMSDAWGKFLPFWVDMGPTWKEGLSLGRIDNDGDYEPGNCAWQTERSQNNNTRATVRMMHKGKLTPLRYIFDDVNAKGPYTLFYDRVARRGWSFEDARNTPPMGVSKT